MLTRIAPTPSGYLHIGNAVNFVLTWLAARQRGGRVLLRIDDLDADRKRPEYVADIFYTLDWLGLDYDLGPSSPDDFEANWSQRHRLARYEATLERLVAVEAVYACGWSRKQLAEFSDTYPAAIRTQHLPLDAPDVAWRFRAEDGGDFVVRRRDGLPAYQIASLTDDMDFGVTHLVRGQDLYDSTRMQRELAERLKRGTSSGRQAITDPGTFLKVQVWHHPLLLDASGQKLAKSAGSGAAGPTSIRAMRLAGESPTPVFRQVGTLLRQSLDTDIGNTPEQGAEQVSSLADLLAISTTADAFFRPIDSVK